MSKHHTKNWIRRDKRLAIYLRDGMACAYCGKGVDDEGTRLSLDHLVCRSHGGSNMEGNLITCCISCNSSRADTLLADWLILKCGNNAAATAKGQSTGDKTWRTLPVPQVKRARKAMMTVTATAETASQINRA